MELQWTSPLTSFFSSESRIYKNPGLISLSLFMFVLELEVLWPHFWFLGHGQEWLERDRSQSSTLLSLDRVNLISMACGTLVILWFSTLLFVAYIIYLQKHLDIESVWNNPHVTSGKVATVYELRRSLQGAITPEILVWFCNLSFPCFVHRICAANTFLLLHQASGTSFARRIQDMEPGKEKTVGAPCVGPETISICFNSTQRSRFCFSCFNDVECKHVFTCFPDALFSPMFLQIWFNSWQSMQSLHTNGLLL